MPGDSPRVSVIVPTYNRAELIGAAVRSVLDQSCADLEVVVVDDGSTDDTSRVLASLDDERVRTFRLAGNSGPAAARNHGIENARGEIIAFQDSDDRWHPEKLAMQLARLDASPETVGAVYSKILRISRDGEEFHVPRERLLGREYRREGRILDELARGNFVDLPATIVRRACLDRVGLFDTSYPAIEDWDLWLRIAAEYEFAYVPTALVDAPYSPDSITLDHARNVAALELLIANHRALFRRVGSLAVHLFSIAAHHCAAGDLGAGKSTLRRYARAARPSRRSLRFLLMSFRGDEAFRRAFVPVVEEVCGLHVTRDPDA